MTRKTSGPKNLFPCGVSHHLPLQWNEPFQHFSERRRHSPAPPRNRYDKMPEPCNPSSRPRVLSGMRPTGKLHLGNYMGALANWVKLQDEYECYFFIADWHALTTDYADTSQIAPNTIDVMLDYLAAGLDPAKQCALSAEQGAAACRTAPAAGHDYAARLARARAHLQGTAGEPHRQGPDHLRISRLSAADGLRHSASTSRSLFRWARTRRRTWS